MFEPTSISSQCNTRRGVHALVLLALSFFFLFSDRLLSSRLSFFVCFQLRASALWRRLRFGFFVAVALTLAPDPFPFSAFGNSATLEVSCREVREPIQKNSKKKKKNARAALKSDSRPHHPGWGRKENRQKLNPKIKLPNPGRALDSPCHSAQCGMLDDD